MKNVELEIPYGKRSLRLSVPQERFIGILKNRKASNRDIGTLLAESFDNVLGKKNIEDTVADRKVLVVVPDATRSAHLREVLPFLLKKIDARACAIDVIVATGLHKKYDMRQLKSLLGEGITKRYRVFQHDQENRSLVRLGRTKSGIPIVLNRNTMNHDVVISIGVIEPHLYAGYSGGAKTVAIGLAGRQTIDATHGTLFLDDRLTRIGSVWDNPFQKTLWEIEGKATIDFSVNVVNDADGKAVSVFSGDTRAVFENGVAASRHIFEVYAKRPADIAICGIGYPKDINLYQASRAINYIVSVDAPVVRKAGVLIVAAELKDGIGTSPAEAKFYKRLKGMRSPEEFIARIKRAGCVAGEHRAYMVAKPMIDYNIVFVTMGRKRFMDDLPFPCFDTMHKALEHANGIAGVASKICLIPRVLATIARLKIG